MTKREMRAGDAALNRRTLLTAAVATAGALAARPGLAQRPASNSLPARPRLAPAQHRWGPAPPQAPAREGVARVNGVGLWFTDSGGPGEPIVLLHPGTGSGKIWTYQQPVFARAGYRVIAYSRRGHWGSEAGPLDRQGSPVADLHALMDYLKVGRFHLVGSAAGGFILPDYALSHPDRLISMTLACSQGGGIDPAYRKTIADMNPPGFAELPASFREIGPSYRIGNPAGVAEWEALYKTSQSSNDRIRQPPENAVTWAALGSIRVPALVIAGAADLLMPPTLMLQFASHLPGAETAVISEAGHSAYCEQPEAFNTLVLDFVRRHPARRR